MATPASELRPLPSALLFDLDGTIADTEPNWYQAERELLEPYGIEWSFEVAKEFIGQSLTWSSQVIVERYHLPMSPPEFTEQLVSGVHRIATQRRTQWLPGALELLALAQELSLPTALVSMSLHRLCDVVIEDAPAGTFDVVVAGEDVDDGKPAPDAYLLAMERLGVSPGECVIFEDSPPGVLAAIRAGGHVVAIPWQTEAPTYPEIVLRESLVGIDEYELRALRHAPLPREA